MAITKLMHMKECPKCAHKHLGNAISYILDVKHGGEKTNYGEWVGGNAGTGHKEVLDNFLDTKHGFGKPEGRQGYHFVISFAKGEVDEAAAYETVRGFCEKYLGDEYDYVFAIHNDKEHMHGHVVFNSVSRIDGHKYHYKKGDWEKHIQPITDNVCTSHGLEPLAFKEQRTGKTYDSWAAETGKNCSWTDIIRADVDYAIQHASSFGEFQELLGKMGYKLQTGSSKKYNRTYITFVFTAPDGKEHRRRDYNLSPEKQGYSPEEIMRRIQTKEGSRAYEEITARLSQKSAEYLKPDPTEQMKPNPTEYLRPDPMEQAKQIFRKQEKTVFWKQAQTFSRLYQAANYYRLPNPYAVPAYRVRRDMARIDRLLEECRYLKENHISQRADLEKRGESLKDRLSSLKAQRKTLRSLRGFADPKELPELNTRIDGCSKKISEIQREQKILERILKTEEKEPKQKAPRL